MGAKDSFEFAADAFEGGAGTLVAGVGVKADAKHPPGFEGVGQHEQLGLGVGGTADCQAGQPGISDLAGVGSAAAVTRMSLRPRPSLEVPEARRSDNGTVIHAVFQTNDRKGHRGFGVTPGQSGLDVADSFGLALRDGTPVVERGINQRRGDQAVHWRWSSGSRRTWLPCNTVAAVPIFLV